MFKQGQLLLKDQIEGPLVEEAQYKAAHGSPNKPMDLGGILIDCYTLKWGEPVISETGMLEALDISRGGVRPVSRIQQKQGVNHGDGLARLVARFATFSNENKKLTTGMKSRYRTQRR
jgi:hypothetical protein